MQVVKTKKKNAQSVEPHYRSYYNVYLYRNELWDELKSCSETLAQLSKHASIPEELHTSTLDILHKLQDLERFWAFPGKQRIDTLIEFMTAEAYGPLASSVSKLVRGLISKSYYYEQFPSDDSLSQHAEIEPETGHQAHYFQVLIVDDMLEVEEKELRYGLSRLRTSDDEFRYDTVIVNTLQDALIALLFNNNIQSCVLRYHFPFPTKGISPELEQFIQTIYTEHVSEESSPSEMPYHLADIILRFRPELDIFYVTDKPLDQIEDDVHGYFKRIFYRQEDLQDLHLSILKGIQSRYEAPFFQALKTYSQKPTSVFHAMPASRGNSIFKSNWIKDMGEFYGRNIFLAESSSTTGGLDSLLQPTGSLKKAQELAARAFGAHQTFFCTNGTSTANKVVLQAVTRPGDKVLLGRDCHKSHHYGLVLSGASPVYLDAFPIEKYSMYGGIRLEDIKQTLLAFKEAGTLDQVKMIVLTNCTFNGLVYNVERYMEEILAIKPDMVFLWDEAWFAFAYFHNIFRKRTGIHVARKLAAKYRSETYRKTYYSKLKKGKTHVEGMPDPEKVRLRVYCTQSTHKTLTSLRQGSMIHIYDEDFNRKVKTGFHEAYMTHTSTSPSYQVLASLDVGRRQAELEGYQLVERSIERAMILRAKIENNPLLRKYFQILTTEQLVPEQHRTSGLSSFYDPGKGWSDIEHAWATDDFVLDPTKINLHIGRTGIDGDTFKKEFLMGQFGIQVNKTTRNTVLFITNIGTTRSSIAFLVGVLLRIAEELDQKELGFSESEADVHQRHIKRLTREVPPLPNFSYFHEVFRADMRTPDGNMRKAHFLSCEEENCTYLDLDECLEEIENGRTLVSASFAIPYPPGFPVFVPGQVIPFQTLHFMKQSGIQEIHSFNPELGLRVFKQEVIEDLETQMKHAN